MKLSAHIFFILCMLIILSTSAIGSEKQVEVLIIRLERMPEYSNQQEQQNSDRNPFSWPGEFMTKFDTGSKEGNEDIIAGLVLQSIFWDKSNPQAIINSKLVNAGDQIGDVTVEKIKKNHVIIEKGGYFHALEFATKLYDFSEKD